MSLVSPDRLVPFWNNTGETIPPYGLFKVDGLEKKKGRNVLVAVKPDTFGCQDNVAVNGSVSVGADGVGACVYDTGPTPLRVDDLKISTEIPEARDEYSYIGPLDGKFEAYRGSGGFRSLGVLERNRIVLAVRSPLLSLKVTLQEEAFTDGNDYEATVYNDVPSLYANLNRVQVRLRLGASTVDAGTECEVTFDRGDWYITAAECDQ